jgi:hypothetical protein
MPAFAAPRWRVDLARTAITGLGGLGALALVGWHRSGVVTASALAVGAILGLLVTLGIEWIARLRAEVVRLQGIERERDAVREQGVRLRQLLELQVQVAQREAAVNAVHMKVYSDAFIEVGGSQRIPLDALLARIEVSTKAENLHIPLQPPKV